MFISFLISMLFSLITRLKTKIKRAIVSFQKEWSVRLPYLLPNFRPDIAYFALGE